MSLVVGVSFRRAGQIFPFDASDFALRVGDAVIVEGSRGEEFGQIKRAPAVREDAAQQKLPRVLRLATPDDVALRDENARQAELALLRSRERVQSRGLPMKLLRAEYAFDRSQITFYFEAEGRIDFRELVKDLAAQIRTRIQLHQVGARDAARLVGGIGPCGRALCCSSWMPEFAPVTMKMAKEQSLFLNPTKFSGVCGKLMCCLRFEYDTYRETKAQLPSVGAEVETPLGRGRVTDLNVLKEAVLVTLPSGTIREFPATEVARPVVRGCAVLAGGACTGGCSTKSPAAPQSDESGA